MKTGQHKDHGLEAPFGQLSECHRRIEVFLTVLLTVADSKRGGRLAEADREILTAGFHYFRAVIPRHAADEEHSLFPRLRSSADPHAKEGCRRATRGHSGNIWLRWSACTVVTSPLKTTNSFRWRNAC